MWNMFKVNNSKDNRTRSLTWSWFLYCWLWTYLVHYSGISIVDFEQVNSGWELSESFKNRNPSKIGKVPCLVIRKAFMNMKVFQRKPSDCTRIKTICHSNSQNTVRIISPIYMADIALWYTVKRYFLCFANIFLSLGTCIAYACFGAIWVLICL